MRKFCLKAQRKTDKTFAFRRALGLAARVSLPRAILDLLRNCLRICMIGTARRLCGWQ